MNPVPCRDCGEPVLLLPVAQRGGRRWPFAAALAERSTDPQAEQFSYLRGRGVVDVSLLRTVPARVLVRHHCLAYARRKAAEAAAEAEAGPHWIRSTGGVMEERDPEVTGLAYLIPRPVAGRFPPAVPVLAMIARGEVAAPPGMRPGVAFDLPLETAVIGHDVTRLVWALVAEGQVYKPAPGQVVALTAYGETRLREEGPAHAGPGGTASAAPVAEQTWARAGQRYVAPQPQRITLAQARQRIAGLRRGGAARGQPEGELGGAREPCLVPGPLQRSPINSRMLLFGQCARQRRLSTRGQSDGPAFCH